MADTPLSPHLLAVLRDLAEARVDPDRWPALWLEHAAEFERVLKPGWFVRLKPKPSGPLNGAVVSQQGAQYILAALAIAYGPSDRYQQLFRAELAAILPSGGDDSGDLDDSAEPARPHPAALKALAAHFPALARLLRQRRSDIEELAAPATDAEVAEVEAAAGHPLPTAYCRFLRCTAGLWIDALDLRTHNVFVHEPRPGRPRLPSEGLLCFGEYWLEADGDQVLFDPRDPAFATDPPVIYYAHEVPEIRRIAPSFTAFMEGLAGSPMFDR